MLHGAVDPFGVGRRLLELSLMKGSSILFAFVLFEDCCRKQAGGNARIRK